MKIEVTSPNFVPIASIDYGEVFMLGLGEYWVKIDDSDIPVKMRSDGMHYLGVRLSDGVMSLFDASDSVNHVTDAKLVV